jgi:hypothetical protein
MCRWLCFVSIWYVLKGYLEVRLLQTRLFVVPFEEPPWNILLPHMGSDLHCHNITNLYLQQANRMIS